MCRKPWSLVGLAILLLTLVPTSQAVEKVKFATSWVLYGRDAYLFAAPTTRCCLIELNSNEWLVPRSTHCER